MKNNVELSRSVQPRRIDIGNPLCCLLLRHFMMGYKSISLMEVRWRAAFISYTGMSFKPAFIMTSITMLRRTDRKST